MCFYKANPAASQCPTAGGSALVKIEQEQDPSRKESCRTSTLKPTVSKKAKSVKSNSSDKVKIPIGTKTCNEELHEVFEDDESAVNVSSLIERIKVVISALQTNVDLEIINKLTVRRKAIFQDYLETRRDPKRHFNPKGVLKVTFIGEPAIDDGGPRREFFSGN